MTVFTGLLYTQVRIIQDNKWRDLLWMGALLGGCVLMPIDYLQLRLLSVHDALMDSELDDFSFFYFLSPKGKRAIRSLEERTPISEGQSIGTISIKIISSLKV